MSLVSTVLRLTFVGLLVHVLGALLVPSTLRIVCRRVTAEEVAHGPG